MLSWIVVRVVARRFSQAHDRASAGHDGLSHTAESACGSGDRRWRPGLGLVGLRSNRLHPPYLLVSIATFSRFTQVKW